MNKRKTSHWQEKLLVTSQEVHLELEQPTLRASCGNGQAQGATDGQE